MLIVNLELVTEFQKKHPLSRKPLDRWVNESQMAQWTNLVDVKRSFNTTDYANGQYIFNIPGYSYRLYAEVIFTAHIVVVTKIMTHAEYEKNPNVR